VNYVASYVTKFSANHYFAIDGIEMSYIMAATPDEGGIIELYTSHHIAMSNLYIHGWQMPGSGPRTDGAHGGIVVYSYDDVAADAPTVTLTDSVIENSENTGSNTQTGLAARFIGVMTRVTIHDVHCAVLFTIDWNYGYQYNIGYPGGNVSPGAEPFHGNGVYMDPSTLGQSTGYIRNSRFRDVSSNSQMAYPNIRAGATAYVYNNIFSGNISSQGPIHVDPYNYCTGSMHVLPCEGPGNAVILNNVAYIYATEEDTNEMIRIGDRSGASTGPQLVGNLTANNNQVIGPSGTVLLSRPDLISGTYTHLTNLIQTSAQATMQGYDEAHLWAPQNGSGDTVDTGTDESGTFTNTIDGTTRTGTFDIGPHEWVPAVNPSGANRERMHGH
jgi:hypothetical protein